MNIRVLLVSTLVAVGLTGCGQKGPSTTSEPKSDSATATSSTNATSASGSTTATAGARTIEITANDQMKYSINAIEAKPGEELHIVLTNTGSLPKEAMAHNWVLLKSGEDPMAFSAAAATAKDQGYIPDSEKDKVIAHIPLQGPHQTGEVTFKAPDQPGEYPFLCSFPGHAALMKGTLTVK